MCMEIFRVMVLLCVSVRSVERGVLDTRFNVDNRSVRSMGFWNIIISSDRILEV
jgi:hypothetical protein